MFKKIKETIYSFLFSESFHTQAPKLGLLQSINTHRNMLGLCVVAVSLTACKLPKACTGEASLTERLFLQQVSSTSAIIKWRGDSDVVCLGTNDQFLHRSFTAETTAGGHKEAVIDGLKADTTYFYSIGGAGALDTDAGDIEKFQFRTAPESGEVPSDGKTRIWLVGDSGTASASGHEGEALEVLNGFKRYNGDENLDLFIMLGDNAYNVGRDEDYQTAVFDIYPSVLSTTAVWSTIGNHEMGGADYLLPRSWAAYFGVDCGIDEAGDPIEYCNVPTPGVNTASAPSAYDDLDPNTEDNGLPFLDIFSFPTQAEMGGVPSGTELYYSFDYANVHVVNLDSQLSARDDTTREAMKSWLIDDLSATQQDWTIVIFHHPPYSKGENHDSDTAADSTADKPMAYMREEFTTVFELHGVDLVYSGHSHSYERSYYVNGHRGLSDSFDASQHAEIGPLGEPTLGNPSIDIAYPQLSAVSGIDDKVVYTVNGSSGKADSDHEEGRLEHPVHRAFDGASMTQLSLDDQADVYPHGIALLGSVVVDATAKTLTASFIDVHGEVLDTFTIDNGKH